MIVVPYTAAHEATAAALDATGRVWRAEWVGADDSAYWRLLAKLWGARESFTIVEHDIVPTGAALDSLDACGADWCACPYPYMGTVYSGLGCTRFRRGVTASYPDVMDVIAGLSDKDHDPMHWCRIDAWLTEVLAARGMRRCEDHPRVAHLSEHPTHSCFPRPEGS